MLEAPRTASIEEIPILDLSRANTAEGRQSLALELHHAAMNLGFFYVKGHPVTQTTIDAAFATAKRYFSLPLADKMECLMDVRSRRGYMPMFSTKVGENSPDLKESFDFGFELPANDPDVLAGKFMHGPNRWPEKQPWLRETIEIYLDGVMETSRILMRLFALSLKADEDYFIRYFNKPMMHTRLFHYPPQPHTSSDSEFGVAPHVDHGLITILNQDSVGGLEVKTKSGEWVGAPYIEGSFIVNLGNLFKRWTNDYYSSTPHRVINRTDQARFSIPTFVNLDYQTPVECMASCRIAGEPAKYPTEFSGAIIEKMLRADEAKLEEPSAS
ncbi:isopenicillin N synthase family dioxygenase [Halioxenophilus sp. WMMB6]|uniref:isopenicillin N synthase family dioxygenase n=1 Tax=Halioxenophilus sp. WMMB6 TaxID=3073815 RepID=UPI00295EEF29|nr:2-oxoglutarate and iron-dependent oxygenase domain-containing protein [Halioxenophilus sp. WMMB6]